MKAIQILISVLFLSTIAACNSNNSSEDQSKQEVLIKVSGLTGQIGLIETVNGTSHTFTHDGNFPIAIKKGIYQFEIADLNGQRCLLSADLELKCNSIECTADYEPVCAKKPFVNVCVTAPCTTDTYQTFSNACEAQVQNAWPAIESECEALENVAALHTQPVRIAALAVIDLMTDPFKLVSSNISEDTLTVVTQVVGGCGTHELSLYADNIISDPSVTPPQIAISITHLNHDQCERLVNVSKEFDLLPIKENYRRLFPETSGVVRVGLNELGVYEFTL